MIEISDVTKRYGELTALAEVSLRVGQGEIVGLLGPNGAGKTTLLRILTGYFEPTAGAVTIDGVDVVERPDEAQHRIGYLPESTPLYPEMLVQEYLGMIADLRGLPPGEERRPWLADAINATGLAQHLTRPIGALSRGFRQRVGLAQAILHKPKVLILDEPTSGLDPSQVVQVRQLIRDLSKNATVIFSTHILSEVEQVCERAVILYGGRIQRDARLAELQISRELRVGLTHSEGGAGERADAVRELLGNLAGVTGIEAAEPRAGYLTFCLETDGETDVGPSVFRLAQREGWELGELRPGQRNLESVFREVVLAAGARAAASRSSDAEVRS